jgi:hypothetical protein
MNCFVESLSCVFRLSSRVSLLEYPLSFVILDPNGIIVAIEIEAAYNPFIRRLLGCFLSPP